MVPSRNSTISTPGSGYEDRRAGGDCFQSSTEQSLNDADEGTQRYGAEQDLKPLRINKEKTKTMLFNTAKTRDFTPRLKLDDETIELVEEMKLLGVKISSDLKWNSNTDYITKKSFSRL